MFKVRKPWEPELAVNVWLDTVFTSQYKPWSCYQFTLATSGVYSLVSFRKKTVSTFINSVHRETVSGESIPPQQLPFHQSTQPPVSPPQAFSPTRIDNGTGPGRRKSRSFPSPAHRTSLSWGPLGWSSSASFWSCWYFLLKKPNCKGEFAGYYKNSSTRLAAFGSTLVFTRL